MGSHSAGSALRPDLGAVRFLKIRWAAYLGEIFCMDCHTAQELLHAHVYYSVIHSSQDTESMDDGIMKTWST